MSERSLINDHWNRWHLLGAALLAALGVWATREAWIDIYHIASVDEEYSHIFLVPIVALYLVWVRRMRIRHCKPSFTILGPILVAAGWAASYYGFYRLNLAKIQLLDWPARGFFWAMWNVLHVVHLERMGQTMWYMGAVAVVLGCVLSVLGKNVIFRFFPAIGVLVFLIPMPGMIRQEIALPLQAWLAQISQTLLEVFGVEVMRNGNQLIVNHTPVAIAEACNGLRMVFALILVVYAFAFGLPLRNWVRFLLLLASPLVAMLFNIIRILPTAWLYGYESKAVADAFHEYSGWLMLPITFVTLYGLIKLLRWAMVPVTKYTLASQ
jgi:exosortase